MKYVIKIIVHMNHLIQKELMSPILQVSLLCIIKFNINKYMVLWKREHVILHRYLEKKIKNYICFRKGTCPGHVTFLHQKYCYQKL